MTYRHILSTALMLAVTLPVLGAPLAGDYFRVDVQRVNSDVRAEICVRFGDDGKLAMSHTRLSMLWAGTASNPDAFVVATAHGDRTVASEHFAMHGVFVLHDGLIATALDANGNSYVMIGQRDAQCADSAERLSTASLPPVDLQYAPFGGLFSDPCATHFCDPVPNPLRAEEDVPSRLAGRSFAVDWSVTRSSDGASGDADSACWTFGADGALRVSGMTTGAWRPDWLYDLRDTFQLVAGVTTTETLALYGSEVGRGVIEVEGLRTRGTKWEALYGFGREVSGCARD